MKVASTVLRGAETGNGFRLPDNIYLTPLFFVVVWQYSERKKLKKSLIQLLAAPDAARCV